MVKESQGRLGTIMIATPRLGIFDRYQHFIFSRAILESTGMRLLPEKSRGDVTISEIKDLSQTCTLL